MKKIIIKETGRRKVFKGSATTVAVGDMKGIHWRYGKYKSHRNPKRMPAGTYIDITGIEDYYRKGYRTLAPQTVGMHFSTKHIYYVKKELRPKKLPIAVGKRGDDYQKLKQMLRDYSKRQGFKVSPHMTDTVLRRAEYLVRVGDNYTHESALAVALREYGEKHLGVGKKKRSNPKRKRKPIV